MISRTTENVRQNLEDSENFQLLCELQRDLGGFALLANNNRVFIRQGCLLKHSKRGLQQRIFFLVSLNFFSSKSTGNNLKLCRFSVFGCSSVWQQIADYSTVQNSWPCCTSIAHNRKR